MLRRFRRFRRGTHGSSPRSVRTSTVFQTATILEPKINGGARVLGASGQMCYLRPRPTNRRTRTPLFYQRIAHTFLVTFALTIVAYSFSPHRYRNHNICALLKRGGSGLPAPPVPAIYNP